MKSKSSGILLHVSSLPSKYGIGDFGPGAYQFVDDLASLKQSVWQILPLNITDGISGHSPYSSASAFALNSLFISPEKMLQEGLIEEAELENLPDFNLNCVAYEKVTEFKRGLFQSGYQRLKTNKKTKKSFDLFKKKQSDWLDDFVLFELLKQKFESRTWSDWQDEFKYRHTEALERFIQDNKEEVEYRRFIQYLAFSQWEDLRAYAKKKKVKIFGDLPIYVQYDSVDVWKDSQFFKLDENLKPYVVAGVPPDYFSATGQRWGNPIYDWDKIKESGFQWWIQRLQYNLNLFDLVRIDHFRGLVQYWEIPAEEETAINGEWRDVPIDDFFDAAFKKIDKSKIVAEDLGIITDDVKEVMAKYQIPGMKILMFAFCDDLKEHPYLPHNCLENSLVYTGTHDNNTIQGWFANDASDKEKQNLEDYCAVWEKKGFESEGDVAVECDVERKKIMDTEVYQILIELALASDSFLSIFPLQDIFGLGAEARMNTPGTVERNWSWRWNGEGLHGAETDYFRDYLSKYNRD